MYKEGDKAYNTCMKRDLLGMTKQGSDVGYVVTLVASHSHNLFLFEERCFVRFLEPTQVLRRVPFFRANEKWRIPI